MGASMELSIPIVLPRHTKRTLYLLLIFSILKELPDDYASDSARD